MSDTFYLFAADAILVVHALFVGFVVLGFFSVLVGGLRHWEWVRNRWFRYLHLLAIGIVVLQSWFSVVCPITVWEMELRALAGDTVYAGSFITYWLHKLLYFSAPDWVFIVLYTVFGLLVLFGWYFVRPRQ